VGPSLPVVSYLEREREREREERAPRWGRPLGSGPAPGNWAYGRACAGGSETNSPSGDALALLTSPPCRVRSCDIFFFRFYSVG
jgi:hypothetical protein